MKPLRNLVAAWLLALTIGAVAAQAEGQPARYSIYEKDLFHYFVTRPNPAAPCSSYTAANLPSSSHFDAKTGLFTWLPDFGSAGSYTITFGCPDDPVNPAVQGIQVEVARSTPVYLQVNSPKVTLLAAATPATAEQDNDQKSLATMLGVYGISVVTTDDLAAAFAAKTVGDILVVPSYMASALTPNTIEQVVAYVRGGGSILLFGRTPLSEALGISYQKRLTNVTSFIDYLNPQLALTWTEGESVEVFDLSLSDSVLVADKASSNPIVIGRPTAGGRILYSGTNYYDHFSPYGTKGHPYLLYHFMDFFRLKPRVSASSIDAYFDPGNYDLSKVYIEDIVRSWADRGITTVYCAAWHFWINETTGKEWTFGYDHFIDVCHLWGIKVYPWFAFPHVSQKFWFTRPECREKTAGTGEKYIFWRLNVNLQNQACLASVFQFMDDTLNTYDWDGINLAEIYYDYERSIEYFTPMNDDFRKNYSSIAGFDPIDFFNPESRHYYQKDTDAWKQFLQYRTNVVTNLHKTFLDRIFKNLKTENRDVMLTAVDSLHYDYPDVKFPEGFAGFFDTGVDLPAILKLIDTYDFQLQVEDPWPLWSSNPFRYQDFKKTYLATFPRFASNDSALMFDVNIVNNAHDPLRGGTPLYNYPSDIQTGLEFSLLLKNMFTDSQRLALFSENSVEAVDVGRLKWALAGDAVINQEGEGTVSFTTKRTTRFETNRTFYGVSLDGKSWPAWNVLDGSILLPIGNHRLSFDTAGAYAGLRLVGVNCALEDAGVIPGGITVSFDSPRQKAVLTVEAFAKAEREIFRILVDGRAYEAEVYPFYGHYRVFLPKGRHVVEITLGARPSPLRLSPSQSKSNAVPPGRNPSPRRDSKIRN